VVASFPYSTDAYRVLVGPYHGDGAPKRGTRPCVLVSRAFASSRVSRLCDRLFPAGIEAYRKGSAVVVIGLDRRSVGRDNSTVRAPEEGMSSRVCLQSPENNLCEDASCTPQLLLY
jgi:hypothetical protein